MPTRRLVPCRQHGCPKLVERGYCDKHLAMRRKVEPPRKREDKRPNSNDRGYTYAYKVARMIVLKRDVTCVWCRRAKATVAHHLYEEDASAKVHIPERMAGVCRPCHERHHGRLK